MVNEPWHGLVVGIKLVFLVIVLGGGDCMHDGEDDWGFETISNLLYSRLDI